VRWFAVAALCACNQVYDIVETAGPDSDRDGRPDGDDNCTLVANRDQHDGDHDGLGDVCDPCIDGPQLGVDGDADGVDDACDACLTGSNHDEDRDGFLDGCDVCPGQPDDQADVDTDGIGDACDAAPGVTNTRVFFDSFSPPRDGWNTGFQPWAATGDSYSPIFPVDGNFIGAYHPDAHLPSSGWWIDAGVRVDAASPVVGATALLDARVDGGGQAGRSCGVKFDGTKWLAYTPNMSTMQIAVDHTLRLHQQELAGSFLCSIDGVLVDQRAAGTLPGWFPLLETRTPAEYEWIDVVR
jgi:hypothetical protein